MTAPPYFLADRPAPIKPLPQFDERDVLNEVLQSIRLRSAVYCRARMTAPWGFKVEQRDHARFHYITSGRCWIQADGTPDPVPLKRGDLVILANGQAHTLRDQPRSPVEQLSRVLLRLPLDQNKNFVWENGGAPTTMLCGGFRLEERKANPILTSLPPVVVIRDPDGVGVCLRSSFQLVEAELASGGPGSEALVSRMSDVIFLQAVRACFAADCNHAPGLLRGLNDPAIGKALAAVHGRVDHPWTVETMAGEAGMSRSAFSSRFGELVGEPPMSYVSRWRLNRAAHWLRSSDVKIEEVAGRVGYESEAALSRAFKRCFSLSPGAYRRHYAACNSDGSDMHLPIEKVRLYMSEFATARFPTAARLSNESLVRLGGARFSSYTRMKLPHLALFRRTRRPIGCAFVQYPAYGEEFYRDH